jgi:hypothetical protein
MILLIGTAGLASANTVASSTMWFQGSLTDSGGGIYSGVLPMIDENALSVGDGISGFDVYANNGSTAWFGDDPGSGPVWASQSISNNDAWPTWNPDTPDWYQYSLNLYWDAGESQYKWAVRNHPGATAANPWYDTAHWGSIKPAMGVPMSGGMNWTTMFASEDDTGAYLPSTGTPEIPGGAAGKGSTAPAWDMDWSWGSELVPLEYSGFSVNLTDLGEGNFRVSLTPTPIPGALWLLGSGIIGLVGIRRKFMS